MQDKFSVLTSEEFNKLAEMPMYISLLIGQADGDLDHKEIEWAGKVTHFRTKTAHHTLRSFYTKSNEVIVERMNLAISELPEAQEEKMVFLDNKIASCNATLEKLDETTRERLIDSFKSLALSVAEISGGLINFFSTNPAEEKWLHLPMIKH